MNLFFNVRFATKLLAPCVLLSLCTGCSSSDTGAVLPSSEIDKVAPRLVRSTPSETEALSANASVQFDFSEVLDKASLDDSVKLVAQKNRDIYSSAIVGSSDFVTIDSDFRKKSLSAEDRLITVEGVVVVGETVDEDDNVVLETIDIVNELLATRVRVESGAGRFPLASILSVVFSRQTKDTSPIGSIDPVTNELTTGNFLEADFSYSFSIADGELNPPASVNTSFLSGSNFVGKTKFESLTAAGLLVWEQLFEVSPGDETKGLFSKTFDYDVQEFGATPMRLDYISTLDYATNGVDNVVLDSSSDSLGSTVCATWTNQDNDVPPIQQSVMVRCGNGVDYSARVVLRAHVFGPQISLLKVILLSEQSAFVSYVYDGTYYMYKLLLSQNGVAVSLQDSATFGSGSVAVRDVAVANSNEGSSSERIVALVSIVDSTAPAAERNRLVSNELILDSGSISVSSSTVETGGNSFNQVSIGFDELGTGLGSWLQGAGIDQRFYTSRYNGNFWQPSVGVVKDGRGPITEGGLHVFEDGQAAFFWVQDIGIEQQLRVQGLFSSGGGGSLSRPPFLTVDSNLSTISSLKFSGDREGNGVLLYDLGGARLESSRFLHNTVWDDAWGSPELVASNANTDSASVGQILDDGRMVFSYPRTSAPYDVLETRVFSDYQ